MISQATFDLLKPMPPFIRPLRDANREGRKSQTRRVINPQVHDVYWEKKMNHASLFNPRTEFVRFCPYGKADELRYMREPLFKGPFDFAHYVDSKTVAFSLLTGEPIQWRWKKDVLSQLYMPKEAARTFKKYEFIRVEMLQEISDEDAISEGITLTSTGLFKAKLPDNHHADYVETNSAKGTYTVLWDAINCERGYPWKDNWWIWVIGYKPLEVSNET